MKAAAESQSPWREVARYASWDQADAVRTTTVRENPSLDVRLRYAPGAYVLEVRKAPR